MKKQLALVMAFCTASLLFGQMHFGVGVHGYVDVPTGTSLNHDRFNSDYYNVALFEGVGLGFAASAVIARENLKGFNAALELGIAHNEIGWSSVVSKLEMKGKLSYTSFDIPILAGYSFGKGNFRITPQIGPYISIPIGSLKYDVERVENNGDLLSNDTFSIDLDIGSKALFGALGAINVGYKVGKGIVNFDARFMADFTALKFDDDTKKGIAVLTRRKTTFGIGYIHFF